MAERVGVASKDLGQLVSNSEFFDNGFCVFTTSFCPEDVYEVVKRRTSIEGIDWFQKGRAFIPSRRDIFFLDRMVMKKKKPTQSSEDLQLFANTRYLLPEIRSSVALISILNNYLPSVEIEIDGIPYEINLSVQEPWGGIVNMNNSEDRYGVFQYIPGISPRNEVEYHGSWNDTPEDLRKLFGKIQTVMEQVYVLCRRFGLDARDLGAHQTVYNIDRQVREGELYILDTEEYHSPSTEPFDPGSFTGLPPTLLYKGLGIY